MHKRFLKLRIEAARRTRPLTIERLESRSLLATLLPGFSETVVASGISSATAMELAPNNDLWVLEQGGAVKRFRPGSTTADTVGNLSTLGLNASGERGLLGIAFDPLYVSNKQVFLYYTATTPNTHNRISRFTVNDADAADYFFAGASTVPADAGSSGTPTQTIIFELDALSGATNHNGGAIHFGPDGKLYAAVGENAAPDNAQTLANLHGKMLRINSDGTVPSDNPFFNTATSDERAIWALGLRNPFTFTFQPGTGRMFINDVGAGTWEEINDGLAGSNYGWPHVEGNQGTPPTSPGTYRAPLYAYSHEGGAFQGFAITGGAFYNPSVQQFPAQYTSDYFFADYVSDWINVLDVSSGGVTQFASGALGAVDLRVSSDGSLYYLARGVNQAFRVIFESNPASKIKDDGDSGFSTVGNWIPYPNQGYQNDVTYAAAGSGAEVASWNFAGLTPGQYRVSASWSPQQNRATNAPYTVVDGSTPLATVLVNQELAPNDFSDSGVAWEDLGTFVISGSTLLVRLSNAANEYVIADVIRIERLGDSAAGPEIQVLEGATDIPDNSGSVSFGATSPGTPVSKTFTVRNTGNQALTLGAISVPPGFSTSGTGATTLTPGASTTFVVQLDATTAGSYVGTLSFGTNDANENPFNFTISGTVAVPPTIQIKDDGDSGFSTVGNWIPYPNQGYQNDVTYAAAGSGAEVASWNFAGLTPGQYRVSASWSPLHNRATNAPYTVVDGSAPLATVLVNQELAPNDLTDSGAAWEDLGTFAVVNSTLTVRLTNAANEYVIADAVRIERVGDIVAAPEIQVLDGAVDVPDNSGSVSFGTTSPGTPVSKTFTVRNTGNQALTLGAISVPPGFSTSGTGATTLTPGASTTFVVQLDATTAGSYVGTLSFGTNDANENPFNFTISGTVAVPPTIQIKDDGDSGFSTVGNWIPYPNQGYQNDVTYAAAGSGAEVASWNFAGLTPGQYRVSASWSPLHNRATNAPYTVVDGSAPLATVLVNQELAPNDFSESGVAWEDLGTFLISGSTLLVRLSNAANEYVIADAIRIERIGDA